MPTANDKRYEEGLDRECSPAAMACSLRTCLAFGLKNPRKNVEGKRAPDGTLHIYDLVFDCQGKELRVETELKKEWKTEWSKPVVHPDVNFKWPTMDVPYRKRDKADVHAHLHHIVGGDGKRVFWVWRKTVLSSPVSDKWVRNRGCYEPFFNVELPAPSSMFWEEVNGVWRITHRWDAKGNLTIKDGVKQ